MNTTSSLRQSICNKSRSFIVQRNSEPTLVIVGRVGVQQMFENQYDLWCRVVAKNISQFRTFLRQSAILGVPVRLVNKPTGIKFQ